MLGVLINVAAVLFGGGFGLLLKGRIPARITDSLSGVLGLCVAVIGLTSALKGDMLLLVVSLALGTFIGEFLGIEAALDRLGRFAQRKLSGNDGAESTIAKGFVTATLLFCVGSMAVVGSLDSGLGNGNSILFTKSILDGVSAMALASALGAGVLLSAASVLVYQGAIVLAANFLSGVLTDGLVLQISAAGGVMMLGIGLNMALKLKPALGVANMLPGLLFAAAYYLVIF